MANHGGECYSFLDHEIRIKQCKSEEFTRLKNVVYLDHAGATLYSERQIKQYTEALATSLYGNPHSNNHSSQVTSDTIEEVRHRVLQWLNTDCNSYNVIFTSGCTAALKLVAECFTYSSAKHEKDQSENIGVSFDHGITHGQNSSRTEQNEEIIQYIKETCGHSENTGSVESHCGASLTDIKNNSSENVTFSEGPKPVNQHGAFICTEDCHTSVLGMQELARQKGATTKCLQYSQLKSYLQTSRLNSNISDICCDCCLHTSGNGLFVYAAQSNFNGMKYPLEWIHQVQCQGRWYAMLDAASYLMASSLDLTRHRPDFVALSFYKIFGFPTGLGALVIRNDSASVLQKTYFGGGTVQVATHSFHVDKANVSERFEDGTIPFLDIIALKYGFDSWQRITGCIHNMTHHTFILAKYVYWHLKSYCHGNGAAVAKVYEDTGFVTMETQGPIIAFNLLHSDGSFVGYSQVDKLAQACNVHLRVGCFCNMGACQAHLGLSDEQIIKNFESGHVCGDSVDIIDGLPTGAIRISFGYITTLDDAKAFLDFIKDCFIEAVHKEDIMDKKDTLVNSAEILKKILCEFEESPQSLTRSIFAADDSNKTMKAYSGSDPVHLIDKSNIDEEAKTYYGGKQTLEPCLRINEYLNDHKVQLNGPAEEANDTMTLKEICLYPVKSCGAYKVPSWPLCTQGLYYDRQWMILLHNGIPLTQKRSTQMCLIRPRIDLKRGTLTLTYPGVPDVTMPLQPAGGENDEIQVCQSKVCGDKVSVADCGDEVAAWLQDVLCRPGLRLVKQNNDVVRQAKVIPKDGRESANLSLANSAQYLLINSHSVEFLQQHIQDNAVHQDEDNNVDLEEMVTRFRGNLVVDASPAFIEEKWKKLLIGNASFLMTDTCSRCQMVCVDQNSGVRGRQPLKAITATRGTKMEFGILLQHCGTIEDKILRVGDTVIIEEYAT